MNFKKIITFVATVCLLVIMLAIPAFAVVTESNGDGYALYNGEKVLASEVPEGAESIPLDGMNVIEWDGDAFGLVNSSGGEFFKVSDAVLSADEISGSYVGFPGVGVEEVPSDVITVGSGYVVVGDLILVSVSEQNVADYNGITFPESGLYFVKSPIAYVSVFAYTPNSSTEGSEISPSLLDNITTFVNSAVSWVGSFVSSIVSNPIILIFCICSFCGLGIGIFARLRR